MRWTPCSTSIAAVFSCSMSFSCSRVPRLLHLHHLPLGSDSFPHRPSGKRRTKDPLSGLPFYLRVPNWRRVLTFTLLHLSDMALSLPTVNVLISLRNPPPPHRGFILYLLYVIHMVRPGPIRIMPRYDKNTLCSQRRTPPVN